MAKADALRRRAEAQQAAVVTNRPEQLHVEEQQQQQQQERNGNNEPCFKIPFVNNQNNNCQRLQSSRWPLTTTSNMGNQTTSTMGT